MRNLFAMCVLMVLAVPAQAQRVDLAVAPCGPDWLIGADRALIPQGWRGADFRAACVRHDACLTNGCQSRYRCDRQWRSDLRDACKNSANPSECRRLVSAMYRATRSYGGRELTPCEKSRAIAELRRANVRYGRNPYPSLVYVSPVYTTSPVVYTSTIYHTPTGYVTHGY